MFDHVTIGVASRGASRRFYDTVLEPLGHRRRPSSSGHDAWGEFRVREEDGSPTRGLHVAFVTGSQAEVDAFWRAGVEAGYASDGEPGLRTVYHDDYYGGFLLDPDGNSVEAVHHGRTRAPGNVVDHLWLRVADLERSKRFWEVVAPVLRLTVRRSDRAERVHVETPTRSFALVAGGTPTERLHLAFPVAGEAAVREFHRVGLSADGTNDSPGERPDRPSDCAASLLDPDGNTVAAVSWAP